MPCKGYGECVMRKWIEMGQTNCIDKSDQGLYLKKKPYKSNMHNQLEPNDYI